jgi:hypothetical protein
MARKGVGVDRVWARGDPESVCMDLHARDRDAERPNPTAQMRLARTSAFA